MEERLLLLQEEGWVVCRIFKKKNHITKTLQNPIITKAANSSTITITTETTQRLIISSDISNDEGTLEQIINMGRTSCKDDENDATNIARQLLVNPTAVMDTTGNNNDDCLQHNEYFVKLQNLEITNSVYNSPEICLNNWGRIDDPLAMDFGSLNSNIDHCYDHLQILHQFPLSSTSSPSPLPYYTPYLFNAQTDHLWSSRQSSLPPSSPVCDMSDSPV